ncbi:MAG: histidine kinase [Myxococcaceae bacterium]|jgi:signal transduction histidine kinase/CheY-like chemotaxis protein|nr:histidine kinase [Myxococcaceae bacterium]
MSVDHRIVVALKEPALRARVIGALSDRWRNVEGVEDGAQAFEACVAEPHAQLLVSDIALPKLDTLSVMRRLKRAMRFPPRVILTASASAESAMTLGLASGASDFLFQPFSDLEICARARVQILAGEAERRALREEARPPRTEVPEPATLPSVLTSMLMSAPVGFCLLDVGLRFVRINGQLAKLAGRTVDACIGRHVAVVFGQDMAIAMEAPFRQALFGNTVNGVRLTTEDQGSGRRVHIASFYPVRIGTQIIGVGMMIDDRTETIAAQTAAADSHAQIVTMNAMKDRFLAVISHELRTPLAAIELWSHALLTGNNTEATLKRGLGSIRASAAAQSRLLEDLLDLSRAVTGKMSLVEGALDVRQVIDRVLDGVHPTIVEKKIVVTRKIASRVPRLQGDAARIEQVLSNLVGNAVLFTPVGGTITVGVDILRTRVVIRVTDTGPGIADELLPYVFEPFRQGKDVGSVGGLGLGLAIAKHIVELHGGSIRCASAPTGATFSVELPRAA